MDDPDRDNECVVAIEDDDPDITGVSSYWTASSTDRSWHPSATTGGNTLWLDDCSGPFDFYAAWDPPTDEVTEEEPAGPEQPPGTIVTKTYHRPREVEEWEAQFNRPVRAFKGAAFTYTVSHTEGQNTGAHGPEPVQYPYLRATVSGASATSPGYFDLRVRPKIDGQWEAYSAPAFMGCMPPDTGGM